MRANGDIKRGGVGVDSSISFHKKKDKGLQKNRDQKGGFNPQREGRGGKRCGNTAWEGQGGAAQNRGDVRGKTL